MTASTSRASLRAELTERLGSALEARWMLEGVLGDADAGDADAVDGDARRAIDELAERRVRGEPLQYLLGSWAFRTLELELDGRVLIPRPETEQVVEVALAEARRQLGELTTPAAKGAPFFVVDLGTGSGAIALSISAELGSLHPELRVAATDIAPGALEVASANRARVAEVHPQVAAQVELREGSWFGALDPAWRGKASLVVSNPPYVSEEEWPALDEEVRKEPFRALVAPVGTDGTPGLACVEAVLVGAREWLAPEGAVVVEMAPHQAPAASRLASLAGYGHVRVEPDLAGRPRAVVARP